MKLGFNILNILLKTGNQLIILIKSIFFHEMYPPPNVFVNLMGADYE